MDIYFKRAVKGKDLNRYIRVSNANRNYWFNIDFLIENKYVIVNGYQNKQRILYYVKDNIKIVLNNLNDLPSSFICEVPAQITLFGPKLYNNHLNIEGYHSKHLISCFYVYYKQY